MVVDDQDRENEGDLIFSAQNIKESQMASMIRDCSGIVCLCMTSEKAQSLDLPLMVKENTSRYGTAFTVSIEASEGVGTGVSAMDRLTTVRAASRRGAIPSDLNRPGHVFPLIARPGGIMERRGHTEATVDLMRLAGLDPIGVLCELMDPDGSGRMAKGPQIKKYGATFGYPVLSVKEIADFLRFKNSIW
nr:3,4-dihydroxy-2-butanone-4-phosphate synthase [uncultured Dethiosulfovibrio sp.]